MGIIARLVVARLVLGVHDVFVQLPAPPGAAPVKMRSTSHARNLHPERCLYIPLARLFPESNLMYSAFTMPFPTPQVPT